MKDRKRIVFTLAVVVLVLLAAELLSFVAFHIFRDRFNFYEPEQHVIAEADVERLSAWYDKRFGWDYHYQTTYTERPRAADYGRPLISSFGDSFMHGTDVGDGETWQEYLAGMAEADVFNFGTGGFGTDQAYLKYRVVAPKLETPVVVLGITSENINRIVNVYRPFYFPKTGIKLPKPRFRLSGARLELIENPIADAGDIGMLSNEGFVRSLGKHDRWYNRDDYPVYRFPYAGILFNKRMWLEAVYGKRNRMIDDTNPRPWEDLWKEEKTVSLMFAIVGSFVEDVRRTGSAPVIMILPIQDEVFQKFCTNTHPGSVSTVLAYCERAGCPCFNSIDVLAGSVSSIDEISDLFIVHVSAAGNRIIAEAFLGFLEEHVPEAFQ